MNQPTHPELGDHNIQLWFAELDAASATLTRCIDLLSPDETKKAECFRFQKDREHYTVARAFLRTLLGRYLDMEPKELSFGYAQHGKPFLATPASASWLRFNAAHSHGRALYGFTRGREIGVDLEKIRPKITADEIAARFFSSVERAGLLAMPGEKRPEGFFRVWTRKEAYLKARGVGLGYPLDQFTVGVEPGQQPLHVAAASDDGLETSWVLQDLKGPQGYAAAVAVEGSELQVECRVWNTS